MFDILPGGGGWAYAAVALAAATPWLEILVVIPPAVGLGLEPVAVGTLAFAGNFLPVVGIVAAHDRLAARRGRREPESARSGRARRARRVMARYGVPGLALLGPLVTGIHLATVLALATGASRRRVVAWMGASLLVWAVGLTVASALGLRLLGR